MPSLPALYILQWVTIGVYVGLYFLIGLLRGAQKSLYFTIVNIITTIVVIVLISNLSIRFLFNFIEFDALIDMINGYTGNALTDYEPYLEDPAIQSTIFIFIDLVLRIIGFFVLYPLMKRILTFFIFRPIWSFGIKKAIIRKQNKDLEAKAEEKHNTYKPRKRIKKGALNRFIGGLFGGVNGLIVAFIILIPITVTASYVSDIDTTNLKAIEQSENLAVNIPGGVSSSVLDEVIKYLEEVQEMDEKGLGSITRQVTVDGVPFDQYVFDEVFTVQTEIDDEAVEVNFIRELENIFGISAVVINGGYLDENFDYTQIDTDNLQDLELIFDYIGNSDVLGYLIPSAARYGIENILADEIGVNLYERTASKEAIDMFINIDWNSEMDRLYALVTSVLAFGSVDEIMGYAEDPASLADLTPEQGVALANILRSVGDLELLSLLNVGLDYLTTLEEAQNQIAWLDTAQEKETYLQERLDFILDDPDFFIGEEGEISEIANLIELIFTDDYGDTNIDTIVDSGGDPKIILEQQNETWVSALLEQLTEIDLLMNALPIGVDYALYSVGGDQVDQDIADDLEIALEDLDWNAEFENFDNIYQNVVALGLEQILVDNPNYITYIDLVVENNMDEVRDIVNHIFTDSQLVSEALDIVAPMIIENYLTDDQLKEIVQSIVLDDEDAFDFNIGGELVTILNIAEYAFEFTSAEELSNIGSLNQEQILEIAAAFGDMDDQTYTQFLASFDQLQILNRIDEDIAISIVENFNLEDTVYIPSDFALNDDITALIDMVHDIGVFFADEYVAGMDYQDIDITDLLDVLSTDLLDSNERSDLLFYNMVFYAKKYAEDDALSAYFKVPTTLLDADIESAAWDTEINQLLGAVFDLAEVIGQTDGITLSVNDILLYSNEAYRLPIEIITQFSDVTVAQDAFSALDSSQIFRASLTEVINTQGQSLSGSLYGYEIQTPDHLQTNGLINAGILVDLIHGAGVFTEGLNETLGFEKIGEFTFEDLSPYFHAFNQMDASEIEALVETDLLHGVISEMLLDDNFQSELVTVLNDAQEIATLPQDFLDVDDDLVDDGVLVSGEITSLFVSLQALELTSTEDFSNIGLETFTNLIVEDTNGEDHFDEFFGSDYIYTLLDRVLQFDGLNDYLNDTLSDAIGGDFQTLDLTIPNAMLGQSADVGTSIEPIEEGRIPRAEFRRILVSLDQIGPLDQLGITTFTNMTNPGDANDNFSTFIESDFVYFVLSRLISNQGFADYAEDALSGAFGDDPVTLDMSVPSDAEGSTGIEDDFISRIELRNLMVSFQLFEFDGETSPDVATIIDMPNYNDYSPTEDNLDIFLNSIYLRDKISQMLLSDVIIDLIGAGQFTSADFNLPSNAYDEQSRLSQDQIHLVFDNLLIMGINDFDNLDISISSVTDLTPAEQSSLLDSLYLYEVIDLMIKAQSSDLSIPDDAYVIDGFYDQMITETEILALFSALAIDGIGSDIGSDSNGIDGISTDLLDEVLKKKSLIINQMISNQIVSVLQIDNSVVPEAYETIPNVDRLLQTDLEALVKSMDYMPNVSNLSTGLSVNDVKISDLELIHNLGLGEPEDDKYNSYLIHYLLSNAIKSVLDVPTLAKMENDYVKKEEVLGIIDALSLISSEPEDDTLNSIIPVALSTFTPSLIEDLLDIGAFTIYRLVADGIITSSVATLESKAELGDVNYDAAAIGDDLKLDEMYGLAEAMKILGIANFTPEEIEIDILVILALTDDQVDIILDNANTIVFYMIDDVVDPNNNLFDPDTFLDESGSERVLRATLITYIKNNN